MDVPRFGIARIRRIRRIGFAVVFLAALSAAAYGLSRLKPAAPSVDRAVLWPDRVKRGSMLRDVHGSGTLVPEDSRWVPAGRDGLVDKINVRIGDRVTPDTVLAELSNPDMLQSLVEAQLQIRAAQAELANTRANHKNLQLNQQTQIANVEAAAQRALLRADADQELARDGLKSPLDVRLSRLDADSLAAQAGREKQRIAIDAQSAEAQILAHEARIEQLRETYAMRQRQIEQLKIRAGTAGILQQFSIEVGQRIGAGATVARITDPGRLKAQLRIPETQAKDLLIGQVASVDTRNGIVPGRVVHIDPAAIQGTVTVDVQFTGGLPKGARPDLSVDGTIEIERLTDVLFVGRPSNGQPNSTIQMFKVLQDGDAVRVPVRIGRVSVNSIEIQEGLQEGDEVILSDMSSWDAYDRLTLK